MRRGPRDLTDLTDLTGPAVLHPLAYPGRPVNRPALLTDRALHALTVEGAAPGGWRVRGDGLGGDGELDRALARLGRPPMARRRPVIAVGADGSPGRLRRKLAALDGRWAVPLVPVRVSGLAAGCSGHISRGGYVAVTPYAESTAEATFVVAWLGEDELRAVDATEVPNYRRVLLSGDRFRMHLPSGERLAAAHLYAGVHGLLRDSAGVPMPGGGPQADLLARLLAGSERLRDLLGPDPGRGWPARAPTPRCAPAAPCCYGRRGWSSSPHPGRLRRLPLRPRARACRPTTPALPVTVKAPVASSPVPGVRPTPSDEGHA